MKIAEALKMAEEWTEGQTFHENSEGWRPAIAVMLAEIKRLQDENKGLKDSNAITAGAYGGSLAINDGLDKRVTELEASLEQAYSVIGLIQFPVEMARDMFLIYKNIGVTLGKLESV